MVSPGGGLTGAGLSLLETMILLKSRGHELFLIVPGNGSLVEQAHKHGITTKVVSFNAWVFDAHELPGAKRFPTRLKRIVHALAPSLMVAHQLYVWKCDIVYTNTIRACVGGLAALMLRKPHIWHIREFGGPDWGLEFIFPSKFTMALMRRSAKLITNSKAVREHYMQWIDPGRIQPIHNYISPPPPLADIPRMRDDKEIHCLILGAIHKAKGTLDAVRAVIALSGQGIPVHLNIMGTPESKMLNRIQGLIQLTNVADRIHIIEHKPYPAQWQSIQEADVVLNCSRSEAFGRVTVEAMLSGKAVIATRAGGTPEIITDGYNGILYTPGDYRELSEHIRRLYESPHLRRQLGQNARQTAHWFANPERYAQEIDTVIRASSGGNILAA